MKVSRRAAVMKSHLQMAGYSVQELADFWNCSRQTVSNKLHGRTEITVQEAVRFCRMVSANNDEMADIMTAIADGGEVR